MLSFVTMRMRWLAISIALLTAALPAAPAWTARAAECCCGGGTRCRCCAQAHLAPGPHPIARKPHRCPCTEPVDAPAPRHVTVLLAPAIPHAPDLGLPPHPPLGAPIPAGALGSASPPAFGLPPPLPAGLPVLYCSFLC